jgi:ribosome biogenesis GTPase / thiamine phosphate phosphatase
MSSRRADLAKLGWSEWFDERAVACGGPDDTLARVVAVDREQWLLVNESGTFRAKLSGSYAHHHPLSHDLPCVGDWLFVEKRENDDFGVIHALLDRKTKLCRTLPGSPHDYQVIAANIDCVFIVQSCHFDFNVKRLERYLVMVADGGAEPCVLLTKSDLVDAETRRSQLAAIGAARITAPILTLSSVTREGVDELAQMLKPAMTYCLVGSSGVGKSTIINGLLGRELLETRVVSATGEGRHTTVRRELVILKNGALVIDSPGMREFGILQTERGLEVGFSDIALRASDCRFRDCTHTSEPGCVVLGALETGQIDRAHYDNFIKLRKECEFAQRSNAEKRKKERDFGKFMKSAKKDLDRD